MSNWTLTFSPLSWLSVYVTKISHIPSDADILATVLLSQRVSDFGFSQIGVWTMRFLLWLSWIRTYVIQTWYIPLDADILAGVVLAQGVRNFDFSYPIRRWYSRHGCPGLGCAWLTLITFNWTLIFPPRLVWPSVYVFSTPSYIPVDADVLATFILAQAVRDSGSPCSTGRWYSCHGFLGSDCMFFRFCMSLWTLKLSPRLSWLRL